MPTSLILLLSLWSASSHASAPSCFDERNGRISEVAQAVPGVGRVDVWWDLHCPLCHVLIGRLSNTPGLLVVAHRLGVETGDRALALRELPENVHACRATGTPPSRGLPYSEWRSQGGELVSAWTGLVGPSDAPWIEPSNGK